MNIGGEDRPIKFGMNQSILYCQLRDVSITGMNKEFTAMSEDDKFTGAEIRDLIWSALKDGARFKKKKFEYTNYDVGDWMEGLDPEEITRFMEELVGTISDEKKPTGTSKKKVSK